MQLPNGSTQVDNQNVFDLQKQIANLLRQNKSLLTENEMLNKRFGLVWPEQPEFFIKVISDNKVVYQNGLYKRAGTLESSGSKATLLFDSSQDNEELKRGDSAYLYSGKVSGKNYLGNGGIAYEWKSFTNETYLPTLIKKGEGFGFDDKDGKRNNLLIEGDNYHALQVLQHTHRGAIDVIYIDPPYNTGNKDFKYNDRFISDDDGNRHSSWLSFFEKRLSISKTLLSVDGVVAISIGAYEHANCKLLLDKVFGESMFVACIHVKMSGVQGMKVGTAKRGGIVKNSEFLYVYSKNPRPVKKILYDDSGYDSHYSYWIENGRQISLIDELRKKDEIMSAAKAMLKKSSITNKDLPSLYESLQIFRDFLASNKDKIYCDHNIDGVKIPDNLKNKEWESDVIEYKHTNDKLYFLTKTKDGKIRQRMPLTEKINKSDSFISREGFTTIRGDWWDGFHKDMGNVSKEGGVVFANGKKPVRLISQIIKMLSSKTGLVLDFFAGSGTTGHAVWDLNKEDGGDRKFILVTNNESNICEDVTYERLLFCNLPEHGNYQQGLEYLKIKHVSDGEVGGYQMSASFEHIKEVINVRFGSYTIIEENDDWYVTDAIAVLKNYVKYPSFFEKFSAHPNFGLVTKKERQSQVFRTEAIKHVAVDNVHVFNNEYLNDLYKVVREDI